ncbi:hypothetical protein [Shewanella algae]|uniref:hypothetical protein n=1 Tax=Shewanella algae TaxID=38313 RepID=UPI0011841B67|nr:hypothetical protein [Shewanella algae]TVO80652.1 hypothetical protein AYI76_19445 [Shewanella algae]TVO80696.1 hypothetical protein AYI78_18875 [Shewanella algae]TVO91115.1 hypothetical protein AYI79_18850 [Shewanella algae]
MNIENVNTEPFVGYHLFHEHINITIKILTASLNNTITHVNNSSSDKELGNLIARTDPAWNLPPIWSFAGMSEDQVYGFVSELGLVSAFSALDDFFDGVEAEIERWNSKLPTADKMLPVDSYDKADEKVITIYRKYGWKTNGIDKYLPVLKYFRLARNCIAHRNSKASPALCDYSISNDLEENFSKNFKNKTISSLPKFERDEKVIINPKLAIFASHILRCICKDVNRVLLSYLGEDGVLNMAAQHGFLRERPVETEAYRTPEAIFNFILTDRYRVILKNDTEAISRASNLGIWKQCLRQFESIDRNVCA